MSGGFQVVAVDYDGTLTEGARPDDDVLEAIAAVRAEGRRVVLVTGRILAELRHVFPDVESWFDVIVAENGGVLSSAVGRRRLAAPVAPVLEDALVRRGVPVRGGETLLACDASHDVIVLEEIRRLGLDCQVMYNRAALMVLPAGVSKGTGLHEALGDLGVSHHSAIGVGDAENDHALLEVCELGVVVANAVPSLKDRADVVLDEANGPGITQLLRGPLLRGQERVLPQRWQVQLGRLADGTPAMVPASQINVIITGGSRAGKSYTGGLFAEQLIALDYSVLVVDFEGDHTGLGELRGVLLVGGTSRLPSPEEVVALLRHRFASIVVDLSLLAPADQDTYVGALATTIAAARGATGLPHWIIVDEAHRHFAVHTTGLEAASAKGYCLITWSPQTLRPDTIADIDVVLALPSPEGEDQHVTDFLAVWRPDTGAELAKVFATARPGQGLLAGPSLPRAGLVTFTGRRTGHVRHWHKYARAELPAEQRFYFRHGPGDATGHVAANVYELHHILRQCDDDVIDHHACGHDLSRWAQHVLQDDTLAAGLAEVETSHITTNDIDSTRHRLLRTIEHRYIE
jgi:hydroxymethylpyrimidine pyrophosphatase-like HAD family hydrolase